MIIFGEVHLRRILSAYAAYYNQARTHLALEKDAPRRSAGGPGPVRICAKWTLKANGLAQIHNRVLKTGVPVEFFIPSPDSSHQKIITIGVDCGQSVLCRKGNDQIAMIRRSAHRHDQPAVGGSCEFRDRA